MMTLDSPLHSCLYKILQCEGKIALVVVTTNKFEDLICR
jgi:hypothetical protein